MRVGAGWIVCFATAVAACADPPTVSLVVTPGHEEDALRREPAVRTVTIRGTSPDGEVELEASAAPGGSFELGEVPADQMLTLELRGLDAEGREVARGRSVGIPFGALGEAELPLFLQRLGETARPPGELVASHLRAPAAVFDERYVLTTGGERALDTSGSELDPRRTDFYDLLGWGPATGGQMPRAARSLVVRGSAALLVDATGASWIDLSSGIVSEAVAPEGLEFADVAGGQTIDGLGGRSFVVGATRVDAPSSAVLVVDEAGALSAVTLGAPRRGAGASFAADLGLVITGGSDDAAGAELVAPDGTGSRPLPFPSDPTRGAAAIATSAGVVVLVGGEGPLGPAPTRSLDLDCLSGCAATTLPSLDVPELVAHGRGYEASTTWLVAGETSSGETKLYEIDPAGAVVSPLPLREPRRGATVTPAPNGTLLVLGGELVSGGAALRVESVFPR